MMQAQRVIPPDMICKDKFLLQDTVVPAGTTDEDITSSMVRFCEILLNNFSTYFLFWFLIVSFDSSTKMVANMSKRENLELS